MPLLVTPEEGMFMVRRGDVKEESKADCEDA